MTIHFAIDIMVSIYQADAFDLGVTLIQVIAMGIFVNPYFR
jgi:hypothetical protein